MSRRRAFIAQLTAVAASSLTLGVEELEAKSPQRGPWDTSWLDRLKTAQYRVVFNASDVADGIVTDYVDAFVSGFHEAHGTSDADVRPVIVFRRNGTCMALNDAMWDKYRIGEDAKITDPATKAPARRNIYWSRPPNDKSQYAPTTLDTLTSRGLISLVCNVAMHNWSRGFARRMKLDADTVAADVQANLIPGAIVVPNGIYGLIRAQNAGCAFMQGT